VFAALGRQDPTTNNVKTVIPQPKEHIMAEYLLSVHGSDTDEMPDNVQEMYAAVEAFNKEVRAAGQWVFAGGLNPASTPPSSTGPRAAIR